MGVLYVFVDFLRSWGGIWEIGGFWGMRLWGKCLRCWEEEVELVRVGEADVDGVDVFVSDVNDCIGDGVVVFVSGVCVKGCKKIWESEIG